MPRPPGAQNIQPFESRRTVATTDAQQITHLATQADKKPLEKFEALLRNQRAFLAWIDSRHTELLEAKRTLDPKGRGPKDSVYRKYRWYTQQQSLLEAINGFEVFYKNTFVALGDVLSTYVPAQRIKGSIDAKVLWASQGVASFSELIFEHQLFHSLETIDDVTNMLVGKRRYMPNNPSHVLRQRGIAIQSVFQIRHTLSHNQGRVTQSDRAKFAALGFDARQAEVIDPNKDHLGEVVRDLLLLEAREFTDWLLLSMADFLSEQYKSTGLVLMANRRDEIEKRLGSHRDLTALPWH